MLFLFNAVEYDPFYNDIYSLPYFYINLFTGLSIFASINSFFPDLPNINLDCFTNEDECIWLAYILMASFPAKFYAILFTKEFLVIDFYFDLLLKANLDFLNEKLFVVAFIFVQFVENEVDVLSNYFWVGIYCTLSSIPDTVVEEKFDYKPVLLEKPVIASLLIFLSFDVLAWLFT